MTDGFASAGRSTLLRSASPVRKSRSSTAVHTACQHQMSWGCQRGTYSLVGLYLPRRRNS
jgi:hypothetical protein